MRIDPTITSAVDEALVGLDASVYDIEWAGRVLRVSLDRPGGIDLDTLATANRRIGAALDLADTITGAYQLEVASPGLERTLRTPTHWRDALAMTVKVKTLPHVEGDRRIEGAVVSSDDRGATISVDGTEVTVAFDDIERARTVFVWGPAPKPGGPRSNATKSDRPAPPPHENGVPA